MASLSNDLEGLSLDLPDVVVSTTKGGSVDTPETSRPKGRRRRGQKKNARPKPNPEQKSKDDNVTDAIDLVDEEAVDGACALVDDQRVPQIDLPDDLFPDLGPDPECSSKNIPNLEADKSLPPDGGQGGSGGGARSRRNKKGGKRKRKREPPTAAASSSSATDNNDTTKPQSSGEASSKTDDGKEGLSEAGRKGEPFEPALDSDEENEEEPMYVWRNVTRNGCIKKCILVDGKIELGRPRPGDTVLVKTQGKLKDGTIIDDYPTLVFQVGEYEVVDGIDLAIQSMYKNELSIVSIKPEMAYGSQGRGTRASCGRIEEQSIPGDARITYLCGLLHFEKTKDISSMTWGQRRKAGQQRLRLANWWYQRKEYPIAVKCYKKALQFYNDIPTNRECATAEEYRELLQLMEERLRVMQKVANIFKRIANLIQSGQIEV